MPDQNRKYNITDSIWDDEPTAGGESLWGDSEPAPEKDEGWLESVGGVPGLAALGTRGISGAMAAPGGAYGAGVAGGGELLAELLEGSLKKQSLPKTLERVGVEAGIGAVPFGKIFKVGKPLATAARGAIFSGTGEAAREATSGESLTPDLSRIDPGKVAMSAGTGGALTGLTSWLMKLAGMKDLGTKLGGKAPVAKGPTGTEAVSQRMEKWSPTQKKLADRYQEQFEVGLGKKTTDIGKREERLADEFERASVRRDQKTQDALRRKEENDIALGRVKEAIEQGGLVPKTGKPSEAYSAKVPGGRARVGVKYITPKDVEDEAEAAISPLSKAKAKFEDLFGPEGPKPAFEWPEVGKGKFAPTAEGSHVQVPPAAAAEPPKVPPYTGKRYTGHPEVEAEFDRLGDAYRAAQGTEKRGLGAELSELRQFMEGKKMRPEWRGKVGTEASKVAPTAEPPTAPPPAPDQWMKDAEAEVLENLSKATPEQRTSFWQRMAATGKRAEGEKGAIDPILLARLGLGAGGALTGAVLDPLDNPFASAVVMGAAGAAAPSAPRVLRKLGVPEEAIKGMPDTPDTPAGIVEKAKQLYHLFPQYQRFSYLMDTIGLPANMWAGPYGSFLMGSIEKALAGDARGVAALKLAANPMNFFREFSKAIPEATKLMERAEGPTFTAAKGLTQKVLATPGVGMSAGDVAARNLLQSVGFSADEARTITLTSEPILPSLKRFVELGKPREGKTPVLANILAPFRRTPANILEQGAYRTPGVGLLANLLKKGKIDREALAQQAVGTGASVGAYELGKSVDPESAKWMRRVVSNLGGQYSLPVTLGFAAGQAKRRGKPTGQAIAQQLPYAFPLPSAEPIAEWAKFGLSLAPGSTAEVKLPRGAVPAFMKKSGNLAQFLNRKSQGENTLGFLESTEEESPEVEEAVARYLASKQGR